MDATSETGKPHTFEDPDYSDFRCDHGSGLVRNVPSILESNQREDSLKSIVHSCDQDFAEEIKVKTLEVRTISERIRSIQVELDRLRSVFVSAYFASDGRAVDWLNSLATASYSYGHRSTIDSVKLSSTFSESLETPTGETTGFTGPFRDPEICPAPTPISLPFSDQSRFYVKAKLIIGNTSQYIPYQEREYSNSSSHKWMAYVRCHPDFTDITSLVNRVEFLLHPSYIPHDTVAVSNPPFRVVRLGYGEFSIRARVHFHDPRLKPVDLIHELKLDKTCTGIQMQGPETVVEIDLHRHAVDSLIGHPTDRIGPDVFQEHVAALSMDRAASRGSCSIIDRTSSKNDLTCTSSAGEVPAVSRIDHTAPRNSNNSLVDFPFELSRFLRGLASQTAEFVTSKRLFVFQRTPTGKCTTLTLARQQACEWQRALYLKRKLEAAFGYVDNLTTRKIMLWCRQNGYTRSYLSGSQSQAEIVGTGWQEIGTELERVSLLASTLTRFKESEFVSKEKSCRTSDSIYESEPIIDILTVDVSSKNHHVITTPRPVCLPKDIFMEWIEMEAQNIGIILGSSSWEGCRVPLSSLVLVSALRAFLRDILRRAVACSLDRTGAMYCSKITAADVVMAIRSCPLCDFVSNAHLGIMSNALVDS